MRLRASDLAGLPAGSWHRAVEDCPRCDAPTYRQPACPGCGYTLSDEVLGALVADGERVQRLGYLLGAAVVLGSAMFLAGTGVGFAAGARRGPVVAEVVREASAAESQRVFRRMPGEAQRAAFASGLQEMLSGVLPAATIRFTPLRTAGGVPPANTTLDLTYEARDASEWMRKTPDERRVLVAGVVALHQRFLSTIGKADTTRFAVLVSVQVPGSAPVQLGFRARTGAITVR